MVSADSADATGVLDTVQHSAKLLVVGAFGVGKTTLIESVSEIYPLRTEETMTAASVGVDDLAGRPGKSATTVALDFGRITISTRTVLYLFGTPGQQRFWDLWAGLSEGAVGALVLIDTRHLQASFEVLDQLETRNPGLPFAVTINHFPDTPQHSHSELRTALDLLPETPILDCDARDRASTANALVAFVEHVLTSQQEGVP